MSYAHTATCIVIMFSVTLYCGPWFIDLIREVFEFLIMCTEIQMRLAMKKCPGYQGVPTLQGVFYTISQDAL